MGRSFTASPPREINSFSPFKSNAPGTNSVPTMNPGVPLMPSARQGTIGVDDLLPFGIAHVGFKLGGVEADFSGQVQE